MVISAATFDGLIARDRQVMRVYAVVVAAGLAIGLLVGLLSVLALSDSERVTTMLRVGGVSVATLGSVLPVRAIRDRYEYVVQLKLVKQRFLELNESTDPDDEQERKEELAWIRQFLRDQYKRR